MKTLFPGQRAVAVGMKVCVEKGADSLRFNREHLLHAGGCDEWGPTLPLSYSISLAPARFMKLHLWPYEAETEKLFNFFLPLLPSPFSISRQEQG